MFFIFGNYRVFDVMFEISVTWCLFVSEAQQYAINSTIRGDFNDCDTVMGFTKWNKFVKNNGSQEQ